MSRRSEYAFSVRTPHDGCNALSSAPAPLCSPSRDPHSLPAFTFPRPPALSQEVEKEEEKGEQGRKGWREAHDSSLPCLPSCATFSLLPVSWFASFPCVRPAKGVVLCCCGATPVIMIAIQNELYIIYSCGHQSVHPAAPLTLVSKRWDLGIF